MGQEVRKISEELFFWLRIVPVVKQKSVCVQSYEGV